MALEIYEVVRRTVQEITRKCYVYLPVAVANGDTTERDEAIEQAIADGKASWRGNPSYGKEREGGEILMVDKVNPAVVRAERESEARALLDIRKAKVAAEKQAKAEAEA